MVNSDAVVGYLWYHWCTYGSSTSVSYETDTNWCFHVFYSTTAPAQADGYDPSDGSYKLSSSTQCAYCVWYWPIAVYEQDYTTYQKLFTYEKWSDWSDWSDEPVAASDTRKVETRTVYRYIDASLAEHNWTDANCTEASTCTICGQSCGSVLGHNYNSVVSTTPTCTKDGVRTYTCSRCKSSYTEPISKLGHSYTTDVTAPTCNTQGYTIHTCANCGSSYKDGFTGATGHTYTSEITTPAGCATTGIRTHTCSNCNDSYAEQIPASGHRYTHTVTSPTCIGEGYTTHSCSNCGNSYQDNFTDPTGHNYIGTTCTDCGSVRDYYLIGWINGADMGCNDDYANLGSYKFVDGQVILTAISDCYVFVKTGDNQNWYMTNGWYPDAQSATLYNTSVGIDANKLFIPAGFSVTLYLTVNDDDTLVLCYTVNECNHNYQSIVTAPTCGADGYTTHTCVTCGDSYTSNIVPATGEHTATISYVNGANVITCSACGKTVSVSGSQFKINGAYLTLSSDVSVIYRVTVPAGFENAYVVFDVNGVKYTATSFGKDTNGRDLFSYPGINPQMMGDNISTTVYATVDGMEVSYTHASYSVLQYCNRQFELGAADKLKTLISDLLVYGAASQKQIGYKTDALVTDLFNYELTPSTFPGVASITNKQTVTGSKTANDVVSASLNLSNQVVLKFGFQFTDTDLSKYTIKVVVAEKVCTYSVADCYAEGGKYYLNFADYSSTQFDDTVTVCVMEGDTVVSRTLTYSVNTYIAKNAGADTDFARLLQAVYNYGISAKNYVG